LKQVIIALLIVLIQVAAGAQDQNVRKYAPFSEYEMTRETEIALARSAAPENISAHATIKVLTRNGFEVVSKGDNGFVCIVMRSWSGAPDPVNSYYAKLRAPICFNPMAARLEGKSPDAIAHEVAAQYGLGQLPKMEGVAFAYMWSASQDTGPWFGAWHPHMMVYAPYYDNAMLGGNDLGGHRPFVVGDGTPYSIVLICVDDKLAIRTKE
jgi:hypothetical protein